MESLGDLMLQLKHAEAAVQAKRSEQESANAVKDDAKSKIAEVRNAAAERIYAMEKLIRDEREAAEQATLAEQERLKQAEALRWDAQIKMRRAERLADSIRRQIEQAERANLKTAEWQTLEQRWDTLTMGAPWREWAKDHQIEGAKKMTYEGALILGDTMGLGKTLTALIAMDMIEAATKQASPDNPVEFGSMQ